MDGHPDLIIKMTKFILPMTEARLSSPGDMGKGTDGQIGQDKFPYLLTGTELSFVSK